MTNVIILIAFVLALAALTRWVIIPIVREQKESARSLAALRASNSKKQDELFKTWDRIIETNAESAAIIKDLAKR